MRTTRRRDDTPEKVERTKRLRAAAYILSHIDSSAPVQRDIDSSAMFYADIYFKELARHNERLQVCAARGWTAGARHVAKHVQHRLDLFKERAAHLALPPLPVVAIPTTLRDILADFEQLDREFDDFTIDLRHGVISVCTDNIVLKDKSTTIQLNSFTISYHYKHSTYYVDANDPVYGDGSGEYPHPHVSDNSLCEGDAKVPIRAAMAQGRIADLFTTINSVLNTYNPASPYWKLHDWGEERCTCNECGDDVIADDEVVCDRCNAILHYDCTYCCDACGNGSYCPGCLERDEEANKYLCRSCRTICSECDRTVIDSDVEEGLCPQCLEKRDEESEDDEDESLTEETQTQETQTDDTTPVTTNV